MNLRVLGLSLWISLALLLTTLQRGLCLTVTSPTPNNTEILLSGEAGNVTFECFVRRDDGSLMVTNWSVENFRGVQGLQPILTALPDVILGGDPTTGIDRIFFPTFQTRLTFPVFNPDLHLVTLRCGYSNHDLGNIRFLLRVYGPPFLSKNRLFRFQEGARDIVVSLERGRPAYPVPQFMWTKDGRLVSNSTRKSYGYPSIFINSVAPADAGVYTLSAVNYVLGDKLRQIESDTGNVTIKVMFGPDIKLSPEQTAVRLGAAFDLVCGTELKSYPPATITWHDPVGNVATSNSRYTVNGTTISFTYTAIFDKGEWTCEIRVDGVNVTTRGGHTTDLLVERKVHTIFVHVLEPPDSPQDLRVDTIGATWIQFSWRPPTIIRQPGITNYVIGAENGRPMLVQTMDATTNTNVTGLLPNTLYTFRVYGVSTAVNTSVLGTPSLPILANTAYTLPNFSCNSAEVVDGNIRISWAFVHTGGWVLTGILVNIHFKDGQVNVTLSGPEVDMSDTTVDIPSLVAGYRYTAVVTASNPEGSTVAECPKVDLTVGIPQDPQVPNIKINNGTVIVTVRTLASGLEPGGELSFTLTEIQTAMLIPVTKEHTKAVGNYRNGDQVEFRIDDLQPGGFYTFTVQAANRFGSSGTITSSVVQLIGGGDGGTPLALAVTASSGTRFVGGIIGGAAGGFLIIVIAGVFLAYKCRRPTANDGAQTDDERTTDYGYTTETHSRTASKRTSMVSNPSRYSNPSRHSKRSKRTRSSRHSYTTE